QRIRALAIDDRFQHLDRERRDIGAIRQLGVGHDRRRITVHEHDLEPFGPQRLTRLAARIVELAGLAADNRTGAADENALQVSATGHISGSGLQALGFGLVTPSRWLTQAWSLKPGA